MAKLWLLRDEFIACAHAGLSQGEAARKLGISLGTACHWADRLGVKFQHGRTRRGADERVATMATMYRHGYTLAQIGAQYGVTRERVRQLLTRWQGITAKDGGATLIAERKREKATARRDARCLAKWGCTFAQYCEIRDCGKAMRAAGRGYYRTPLGAFQSQRSNAARRGIGWELTLWQWWSIWQQSGKLHERGRGQGYVMCREGDSGPYAVGNVFIAPARENSSKQARKKSGLPIGVKRVRSGRFVAYRSIAGKQTSLGTFPSPELAHAAYLSAEARVAA